MKARIDGLVLLHIFIFLPQTILYHLHFRLFLSDEHLFLGIHEFLLEFGEQIVILDEEKKDMWASDFLLIDEGDITGRVWEHLYAYFSQALNNRR